MRVDCVENASVSSRKRSKDRLGVACLVSLAIALAVLIFRIYAVPFAPSEKNDFIIRQLSSNSHVRQSVDNDNNTTLRIGVVVPFTDGRSDSVRNALLRWNSIEYKACEDSSDAFLYFYHSGANSIHEEEIKSYVRDLHLDNCFQGGIQFFYANLPAEIAKHHPSGPCAQFYRLFELLRHKVDYFVIIEPDALPIRANWLSEIHKQVVDLNGNVWLKGSASQCHHRYSQLKARHDFHINGNAIFRVNDKGFDEFLERVQSFYPEYTASEVAVRGCATGQMYEGGHDHAIYQFLHHPSNFEYAQKILHKFQYSDFIINLCEESYDEDDIRAHYPSTYFVHSKAPFFTTAEKVVREVYFAILGEFPSREEMSQWLAGHSLSSSLEGLKEAVIRKLCASEHDVKVLGQAEYCRALCLHDKVFRDDHEEVCAFAKYQLQGVNDIPLGRAVVWTNDFHVAPIACSEELFRDMNVEVNAKIDFSNCMFHSEYCARGLKVLAFDDWRGFSLDPCPTIIRKAFYEAYKYDAEFWRSDLLVCSHPTANCELFMPFNRSILVYATTRLEFGRLDENIDWRQPLIGPHSEKRWRDWVQNLKLIASKPWNFVAANNMYDVHYIKYHTGIDAMYLPSWCGYGSNNRTADKASNKQAAYNSDSQLEYLIAPYRDNLDYPGFEDDASWKHPVLVGLTAAIQAPYRRHHARTKPLHFVRLRKKYPHYEWSDVLRHPAVVWIPYQVSSMSFFEIYRLNIPIFAPSLELLVFWVQRYGLLFERVYGTPPRIPHAHEDTEPALDPNRNWTATTATEFAGLRYWLSWCDLYTFPHIVLFDSWEDLLQKLDARTDLAGISAAMKTFNQMQYEEIKLKWKMFLDVATASHESKPFTPFAVSANIVNTSNAALHVSDRQGITMMPEKLQQRPGYDTFDEAMHQLWNLSPIAPDPPSKVHARCRELEDKYILKTQSPDPPTNPIWNKVSALYETILGRPADTFGAMNYVRLLSSKKMTFEQLSRSLCTSREYSQGGRRKKHVSHCQKLCDKDVSFRRKSRLCPSTPTLLSTWG